MSLNAITPQSYLPEVQALLVILERYLSRWSGASTLERRLLIEAEAIGIFERLLNLEVSLEAIIKGDYPESESMASLYQDYEYLIRIITAKVSTLAQLFLSRFNSQQITLMELTGQINRINQKKAVLNLWDKNLARFVIAEHFLNFDSLATNFISLPECEVETGQGFLTLPVRSKEILKLSKAWITSGSNGNPGNSDAEVQTNNTNTKYMINGDESNWFEYERLDSGPAKLTVVLEFSKPQVVNSLVIEPVNLGVFSSFQIESINFSLSKQGGIPITDLLSSDLDKDFFTVKSDINNEAWSAVFLPVEAKTISITFAQRQSYRIEMYNKSEDKVLRDRYAIAIQAITPYRIEYEEEGGINSKVLELSGGLYSATPFADLYPQNDSLYDALFELSFNSGETWSTVQDLSSGELDNILMSGNEKEVVWRLALARNSTAFKDVTDYNKSNEQITQTDSILRVVSRHQSPVDLVLPQKPYNQEVFVLQPKIGRRGDRFNPIKIGEGTGHESSFNFPVELSDPSIQDQIHIYVSGIEYERVGRVSKLIAQKWMFSDDYKQILFDSSLPLGADIATVINEELVAFDGKSDGYYHKMDFLFDPDKHNITLKYLPQVITGTSIVLPRYKEVIFLGHKNIIGSSFILNSENSITYTSVASREDVSSLIPNLYYLDPVNGVLYLSSVLDNDTVKARFRYHEEHIVPNDKFDVVFKDAAPWGIRVNRDNFSAQQVIDTVGANVQPRIEVLTGRYVSRIDNLFTSNNAMTLSHDSIVKGTVFVSDNFLDSNLKPEEVDFVDGKTEFWGLISVDTESTSQIQSSTNIVEFNLAAGALWYQPWGVNFSDTSVFNNQITNIVFDIIDDLLTAGSGSYYIADDGKVYVNVGSTGFLPADIEISYHYKDPSYDSSNKYSIDYLNSIVYSESGMVTGETVNYQAASYKIAYDIALKVNNYSYDSSLNIVSVRTENLNPINSLIKVLWTKQPLASRLDELKNYFSPLISLLAVRFD